MKLKELIKDIEVLSTNAAPDTEISGISYDSRLTRPGDLRNGRHFRHLPWRCGNICVHVHHVR